MSQQLGTEKIEKAADALAHLVVAGKKISADKKVDLQDLPAAMELITKLPQIVEAFSDIKGIVEEGADIDVSEIVALIGKVDELVKKIEKA
jgi:hypothetical protein